MHSTQRKTAPSIPSRRLGVVVPFTPSAQGSTSGINATRTWADVLSVTVIILHLALNGLCILKLQHLLQPLALVLTVLGRRLFFIDAITQYSRPIGGEQGSNTAAQLVRCYTQTKKRTQNTHGVHGKVVDHGRVLLWHWSSEAVLDRLS